MAALCGTHDHSARKALQPRERVCTSGNKDGRLKYRTQHAQAGLWKACIRRTGSCARYCGALFLATIQREIGPMGRCDSRKGDG